MAHSPTFHSNATTAEDFADVQDVEIELLDMTNATRDVCLTSGQFSIYLQVSN